MPTDLVQSVGLLIMAVAYLLHSYGQRQHNKRLDHIVGVLRDARIIKDVNDIMLEQMEEISGAALYQKHVIDHKRSIARRAAHYCEMDVLVSYCQVCYQTTRCIRLIPGMTPEMTVCLPCIDHAKDYIENV